MLEKGKESQWKDAVDDLKQAVAVFHNIRGWRDADERIEQCEERIKEIKFHEGLAKQEQRESLHSLYDAITVFDELSGYRDAAERAEACRARIKEIKEAERIAAEQAKKKRKLTAILAIGAISAVAVSLCLWQIMIMPAQNKKLAEKALAAGNLPQAIALYDKAGENGKVEELYLELAKEALAAGNLPQAADLYGKGGEAEKAADLYRQLSGRIAAGSNHTVGLKADGTVVAVGDHDDGQCDVSGWTDIVAVAAGNRYTVGLKAGGTVVAAGYAKQGQCDVSGWTDIVAVAVGDHHTVGLKADGTAVAVGLNGGKRNVCDWDLW